MANVERKLTSWDATPLGTHYLLAIFDVAIVRLRSADHVTDRSVHWGIGCLADGKYEPLGVWIDTATGVKNSLRIAAHLQFRGVERIWHITGSEAESVLQHLTAVFSDIAVFSCDDSTPSKSLAAPRRREPSLAEIAAEEVREYLIRAIRRHGSFENEAAALDFISGALQRTERRLGRGCAAKVRPRQRSGAQTVPPGH